MTNQARSFPLRVASLGYILALTAVGAALSSGANAADQQPSDILQPVAKNQQSANGPDVYTQSGCVVCHGGFGTGGFGPRLAGNPILAISQYVVAQILIGRGQMPPFADRLSDEQIAAVAGYIRSNWGNDFGPVTTKEAADTRNLMKQAMQAASRVSQAEQTQK